MKIFVFRSVDLESYGIRKQQKQRLLSKIGANNFVAAENLSSPRAENIGSSGWRRGSESPRSFQ